MRKAAERHGLTQLLQLEDKWFDVMGVFVQGRVVIPGMTSFGLKSVSEALSDYASRYGVDYGEELNNGGGCMVAAWSAYEKEKPIQSAEMQLVAEYLENDVLALCNTVMWLRAVCRQQAAKRACSWYPSFRCAGVVDGVGRGWTGWYGEGTRLLQPGSE